MAQAHQQEVVSYWDLAKALTDIPAAISWCRDRKLLASEMACSGVGTGGAHNNRLLSQVKVHMGVVNNCFTCTWTSTAALDAAGSLRRYGTAYSYLLLQ